MTPDALLIAGDQRALPGLPMSRAMQLLKGENKECDGGRCPASLCRRAPLALRDGGCRCFGFHTLPAPPLFGWCLLHMNVDGSPKTSAHSGATLFSTFPQPGHLHQSLASPRNLWSANLEPVKHAKERCAPAAADERATYAAGSRRAFSGRYATMQPKHGRGGGQFRGAISTYDKREVLQKQRALKAKKVRRSIDCGTVRVAA